MDEKMDEKNRFLNGKEQWKSALGRMDFLNGKDEEKKAKSIE
jgi:hypothetical protein